MDLHRIVRIYGKCGVLAAECRLPCLLSQQFGAARKSDQPRLNEAVKFETARRSCSSVSQHNADVMNSQRDVVCFLFSAGAFADRRCSR
jgi:hypothetical protein